MREGERTAGLLIKTVVLLRCGERDDGVVTIVATGEEDANQSLVSRTCGG